jgi:hypothetical protein
MACMAIFLDKIFLLTILDTCSKIPKEFLGEKSLKDWIRLPGPDPATTFLLRNVRKEVVGKFKGGKK